MNDGITIIPELATIDMNPEQQQNLRKFKQPALSGSEPVVHRDFIKKKLIEV
jgi:LysR family hydrogen peroxide-inducible transcriptional activator